MDIIYLYSLVDSFRKREEFLSIKNTSQLASLLNIEVRTLMKYALLSYLRKKKDQGIQKEFDKFCNNAKSLKNKSNEDTFFKDVIYKYLKIYIDAVYRYERPKNICDSKSKSYWAYSEMPKINRGNGLLIALKIQDFNSSITLLEIQKSFMRDPFLMSEGTASAMALLLTYENKKITMQTSNIVMLSTDRNLSAIAEKHGYKYSRKLDRIAFSGNHYPDTLFFNSISRAFENIGLYYWEHQVESFNISNCIKNLES
ncbi:MAG TPA: hypothetical protein VMV56_04100 [Williamwhitmania sp.]|nr:hypothetical protein [Williamwhitmania sp.]